MNIIKETTKLKKELVILRINKITKQKNERNKIKETQHKISQILNIKNKRNDQQRNIWNCYKQ